MFSWRKMNNFSSLKSRQLYHLHHATLWVGNAVPRAQFCFLALKKICCLLLQLLISFPRNCTVQYVFLLLPQINTKCLQSRPSVKYYVSKKPGWLCQAPSAPDSRVGTTARNRVWGTNSDTQSVNNPIDRIWASNCTIKLKVHKKHPRTACTLG